MRWRRTETLAVLAIVGTTLLTGCDRSLPEQDLAEWVGELEPVSDFPEAGGRAYAHVREGQTRARIEFQGGAPGVEHGWRIAHGSCAQGGDVLPREEEVTIPAVQMDPQGRGDASATLAEALMPGQRYHVTVHWGEEDLNPVLACGELLQR